jgi:KDO2-lipid IV(A) lauroyltransferase
MYWLFRGLIFIFSKLPLKFLQSFAGGVGAIAWYILPERRRIAKINAHIITQGIENIDSDKIAKKSFRHTFMSYFETAYIHNVDAAFLDKYVKCEGKEHYDKLVANDEKFLFINAHIGAWDLSSIVVSKLYGFKGLIVGRESKNKTLNRLLDDLRNTQELDYVTEQGYLERVAEYEKQGYVTGSLLDHGTTRGNSIIAPFFGYRVPTIAGIAAVSARKKIPMLPTYLIRTETGFLIVTHPPIYPNSELKPKDRILDLVTRMNAEFEVIIRKYPEQWYLLHKRFKRVEGTDGEISNSIYRS